MSPATPLPAPAVRHSILDLAPLELDCLNALWPRGEATVREIQQAMAPTRPRAYTTIMTILDRLAQKGVVERRKTGRAWTYRANVSEQDARSRAVTQLVNSFFEGSAEALAAHLLSLPSGEPQMPSKHQGPKLVKPRLVKFAPVKPAPVEPSPVEKVAESPAIDVAEPEAETPRSPDLETTLL